MAVSSSSTTRAGLRASELTSARTTRFCFDLATPEDNLELQRFSSEAEMPGAIRFSFDRSPDYLAALCVEGRDSEVLVCREGRAQRVIATGHRSIKQAFVNGEAVPLAYLGGLRVEPTARSGQLLAGGYGFLRTLHESHPARFYLTTVMEDNQQAKDVLLSGRLGLPTYHDFGRFCCMAVGMRSWNHPRPNSELVVRRATAADGLSVVEFLNREGPSRQFFPQYRVEDFGSSGGLLSRLEWKDVFLAFHANALVGVLAAWDQRAFRRWRVTGYAPWLGWLRPVVNATARLRGMPVLPKPGSTPDYFILSLTCIRQDDRTVFKALLETIVSQKQAQHSFFLAGLHERDPLLPELLARPHVPLPSRLYVVAWEDSAGVVEKLDRWRVPYLELGAL